MNGEQGGPGGLGSAPDGQGEPGKDAEADADEFVSAVLVASRVLMGVSTRSLAEIDDPVTVTQFRTLLVLDTHGGQINLNGLAEELGVNASTAMRTVDRLIAPGYVTRQENPANRREVLLGLTDDGERLVQQVTARRRAEIAAIVASMPAARRGELAAAFTSFAKAAGEPLPRLAAGARPGW